MDEILIRFGNFVSNLPGVVSQGLMYGVMAIGLFITFKILEISDLTVDGSFCTGAATCLVSITMGCSVWTAMLLAFILGMMTGAITGFLHTVCKIPAILAGILTQMALFTINMIIIGWEERSLESLLTLSTTDPRLVSSRNLVEFEKFFEYPPFILTVITVVIIAVLYWFFGTELGASIRATGANENMARAQGINTNINKMIGLMLANGLVALSGGLFAQYNGSVDNKFGIGTIVIGLASIVIGDVLFGKLFKNFALKLFAVSIGAIIYYMVIQAVLTLLNVDSEYLKLMSAIIVAVFLTVPNLRKGHVKKHKKVEVS